VATHAKNLTVADGGRSWHADLLPLRTASLHAVHAAGINNSGVPVAAGQSNVCIVATGSLCALIHSEASGGYSPGIPRGYFEHV